VCAASDLLTMYASYYNESGTYLSLHKDAPLGRTVQRYGNIAATPVVSKLHHRYAPMYSRKGQEPALLIMLLYCLGFSRGKLERNTE
jgi:hypothetical protein